VKLVVFPCRGSLVISGNKRKRRLQDLDGAAIAKAVWEGAGDVTQWLPNI
jgi:hypothetical protein